MAKEVIFVADDFGMSPEINDAILHAHTEGALHGAALMMGQSATDEAIEWAKLHPQLQVGFHLHVTDSRPTTTSHWPWGSSPVGAGFAVGLLPSARKLMRAEVARQWQLFQATGLECRFINSHHHLHSHPFVYRALRSVVGPKFDGWIRAGTPQPMGEPPSPAMRGAILGSQLMSRRNRLSSWRASDTLWGLDRLFQMKAIEVRQAIAHLPDGLHEFMFHPRTRHCPDTLCLLDLK